MVNVVRYFWYGDMGIGNMMLLGHGDTVTCDGVWRCGNWMMR